MVDTKTCHWCHGLSDDYRVARLKRCAGCRKVYYCSTACQKNNWVEHIFDCKPRRPINTADYLALAVHRNLLPEHTQTCCDYGFARALTTEATSKLLDLYIGLIKTMGVSPKTIHDWRVRGVLVDEIKAAYYKVPEMCRASYFLWFLQHEHVIAQANQPLPDETMHDHYGFLLERAWRYTGGSASDSPKEIKAAVARMPAEDQRCHVLYTLILSKRYPLPDQDLWINFGFASCATQRNTTELSALYRLLIARCTFKEFCDAYRTHRLLDLFRSKGLPLKDDEGLRDLLRGETTKSVWFLKRLIASEASTQGESTICLPVMVDYGFFNCRNDSERRELKRVYKAFFEKHSGDPLALHEAAMKGSIHGYLSKVVHGLRDPKFRRLMKNPYPLLNL